MGSIEVFDYVQRKWVPYIPPPDNAERIYQEIKADIDKHNKQNSYLTDREPVQKREDWVPQPKPKVVQVTAISQAYERAKSEQKRLQQQHGAQTRVPADSDKKKPWSSVHRYDSQLK